MAVAIPKRGLGPLDRLYDVALTANVIRGQKTAAELADDYYSVSATPEEAVEKLIRWQCGKSALSGFVTGLPGLPFLAATFPVDLAAVWYIQLRMVAAMAIVYGLDPGRDQVRMIALGVVLGTAAQESVQKGVSIAARKAVQAQLARTSAKGLLALNKKLGFRFITKAGSTGVVNLGKAVPLVGGVAGASVNFAGTYGVGRLAKKLLGELRNAEAISCPHPPGMQTAP